MERPAKQRKVETTPPVVPMAGLEPKAPLQGRTSRPSSRASSRHVSREPSPVQGLVTAAPSPDRGRTPPTSAQLHKSKSAADVAQSAALPPLSVSPVRRWSNVPLSPGSSARAEMSPSKLPPRRSGPVALAATAPGAQRGPTPAAHRPQINPGSAIVRSVLPAAGAAGAAASTPLPVAGQATRPSAGSRGAPPGAGSTMGVVSAAPAVLFGANPGSPFQARDSLGGSVLLPEPAAQATARTGDLQAVGLPALPQRQGTRAGVSSPGRAAAMGRPRASPPVVAPSPPPAVGIPRPSPPAKIDPFPVRTSSADTNTIRLS